MELKEKFRKKMKTLGTWVTQAHRYNVEIAANAQYDWLCIDLEHSTIDLDQMGQLIALAKARGIAPLVRVSELNVTLIKRVMDAGAVGIIVPMINTAEQARSAYSAMQYPPLGCRGVGLSSAQSFGATFNEYKSWLKDSAVLIVQIEHIQAVENFDEIMALSEVDGYIVGPYDLSASLGAPGDFKNPTFLTAMKRIEESHAKHSKAKGIHIVEPNAEEVKKAVQAGFDFIAYSFEARILDNDLRKAHKAFHEG